ncbi:MAG: Na/Pi cotransporter family protein [Pontiellaceae bacterium]|nr:Na/Pi cotransporter family protein [Pontiellaceae bacterium]
MEITTELIVEMISNALGGLCLFLLGMKYLSDGIQAVAGDKMRKMIAVVTDNRFAACGTGLVVTTIIQSSSVTTVMLIGLVNAGIMTLQQSIGVILGADIGTTVTAWIVAVKITKYGLIITAISGFFYLFSRNERNRFIAMLIMGLGLVFFGLFLMEHGVAPIRDHEGFKNLFSIFSPDSYWGVIKCVLVGAFVTGAVQSSSATIAITITLARAGVIDFDTSVALVLGQNIGTTITAFLASIGTSIQARRVAYAHIAIKIIAVVLTVPLFFMYLKLLGVIIHPNADIATRIALSHTIFNVLLVLVFIPFIQYLKRFLEYAFVDKEPSKARALIKLDKRLVETPVIAIEQSRREVIRMGEVVGSMMNTLKEIVSGTTENRKEKIETLFNQEEYLDRMQQELVVFLTALLSQELISKIAKESQEQIKRADEYESASDYIVVILKLLLRLENAKITLDEEEVRDILDLHDSVYEYYKFIFNAFCDDKPGIIVAARSRGEAITHQFRQMRSRHLAKLSGNPLDPLICTVYPDILSGYRRMKEHLLTSAEAEMDDKEEL